MQTSHLQMPLNLTSSIILGNNFIASSLPPEGAVPCRIRKRDARRRSRQHASRRREPGFRKPPRPLGQNCARDKVAVNREFGSRPRSAVGQNGKFCRRWAKRKRGAAVRAGRLAYADSAHRFHQTSSSLLPAKIVQTQSNGCLAGYLRQSVRKPQLHIPIRNFSIIAGLEQARHHPYE